MHKAAAYDDTSLISVYCHLQFSTPSQSSRPLPSRRITSSQSPRWISSPSYETTNPRNLHIHYNVHIQLNKINITYNNGASLMLISDDSKLQCTLTAYTHTGNFLIYRESHNVLLHTIHTQSCLERVVTSCTNL